jgi:hypothetical protein
VDFESFFLYFFTSLIFFLIISDCVLKSLATTSKLQYLAKYDCPRRKSGASPQFYQLLLMAP